MTVLTDSKFTVPVIVCYHTANGPLHHAPQKDGDRQMLTEIPLALLRPLVPLWLCRAWKFTNKQEHGYKSEHCFIARYDTPWYPRTKEEWTGSFSLIQPVTFHMENYILWFSRALTWYNSYALMYFTLMRTLGVIKTFSDFRLNKKNQTHLFTTFFS